MRHVSESKSNNNEQLKHLDGILIPDVDARAATGDVLLQNKIKPHTDTFVVQHSIQTPYSRFMKSLEIEKSVKRM